MVVSDHLRRIQKLRNGSYYQLMEDGLSLLITRLGNGGSFNKIILGVKDFLKSEQDRKRDSS